MQQQQQQQQSAAHQQTANNSDPTTTTNCSNQKIQPGAAADSQGYDIQMDQFQVIDNNTQKQQQKQQNATTNIISGNQNTTTQQPPDPPNTSATLNNTNVGTVVKRGDEAEAGGFFLTGVNVQNQDIEQYAVSEPAKPESSVESPKPQAVIEEHDENAQLLLEQEQQNAIQVDKYKMVAVVDSARSFANSECVYVDMSKNEICHLSVDSHTSLKFDELISSYEQVFRIGRAMAHTFMTRRNTNKIVLNVSDQFATNNNCGFNLANFKHKFLKNYYKDVVQDYERSFIGSFSHALLQTYLPSTDDQFELYFTIAKFEGNMGYSLTQNFDSGVMSDEIPSADGQAVQNRDQAQQQQNKDLQEQRRQEILKKGSIPEFVQIKNTMDFYQVYQEANHRNKLLVESQRQQQIQNYLSNGGVGATAGDPAKLAPQDPQSIDLQNIKDDVVIMQFKLVRKDAMKVVNTQTFINLPISKMHDINISTLLEIVHKQNQQLGNSYSFGNKRQSGTRSGHSQFLPYNKSIMTRILYPCLNKSNFLVVNHYSKKTILRHLKQPITGYQAGPAKGLFSSLFKLGFDTLNRLKKKKLSQQAALKILQRTFKTDLKSIFKEIEMFREGIKSFEVYTEQTANQLAKSGMQGMGSIRSSPLTMFHQIIYFLVLQEEMTADAETFASTSGAANLNASQSNCVSQTSNFFPPLLPEEEIQKVIFDENYLQYLYKKQQQGEAINATFDGMQLGTSQISQQNIQQQRQAGSSPNSEHQEGGQATVAPNTSLQAAAMMAKESVLPYGQRQQALSEKEKKMQFVQYESEKSKLKEEYEKRVGFLHKRMSKRATMDPSLLLLNSMTTAQPQTTRNSIARPSSFDPFFQGSMDLMDQLHSQGAQDLRAKQHGQYMQLQKKILGGPPTSSKSMRSSANNRVMQRRAIGGGPSSVNDIRRRNIDHEGPKHPLNHDDDKQKKNSQQKKAEYYKFYLDNAQKAINMMIEQHKSAGNLSQQQRMAAGRCQSISSAGNLSYENDQSASAAIRSEINNNGVMRGNRRGGGQRAVQTSSGVRSNSLHHERRFYGSTNHVATQNNNHPHQQLQQQRLEPLVSRHQKISRITVRQNPQYQQDGTLVEGAGATSAWGNDSNQLEKIDESHMLMMAANRGAANLRRNKPFSANQTSKPIRVIQDTPAGHGLMSTAAYTNSAKPGSGTQNTTNGMMQIPALSNSNTGSNGDENERATTGLVDISSQGGNITAHQQQQQQHILNYSSDQNLLNAKNGGVNSQILHHYGQINIEQQTAHHQAGENIYDEDNLVANAQTNKPIYKLNQGLSGSNRKASTGGNVGNNRANKSFTSSGGNSRMLPPAGPGGTRQTRLIHKAPGSRGSGVRGELLQNGYKSLRAQGMLRVNKLEKNTDAVLQNELYPAAAGTRKKSKEAGGGGAIVDDQNVNICIETTTSKGKNTANQNQQSPLKVNPNLVPKGLGPSRDRQFAKLRSSNQTASASVESANGTVNMDNNSSNKIAGLSIKQQNTADQITDGIQDVVRGSLNSQDRIDLSQESSAINGNGTNNTGGQGGAPSTIQTTKMKASAHILGVESTIEIGQSGSMILVQDTSAAAQSETQNKAAASTSRD